MTSKLSTFASEVTRVSLEVGTEGKLGGQAIVQDVGGTWKDLTDNVNMMATKITDQVRDIATVAYAVAEGDLTKKVVANAQGEVLELKNTMNRMVISFAYCQQNKSKNKINSIAAFLKIGRPVDQLFGRSEQSVT
jgi:HAMP domain-containing protein